jgi:signal transduction histidine kinase
LLVLALLDAQGAAALNLERVDLGAVARDVVEQVRALPLASSRTLRLEADPCVRLNGDARQLHQVLLNLATNALQHVPEGGCATVAIYRDQVQACIDVRDTGVGMPIEQLEHIFDRFYRLDSARSRASGGAGLGLAITRAIVEAHGGTIVAGNAPEAGAVFRVRLPIS